MRKILTSILTGGLFLIASSAQASAAVKQRTTAKQEFRKSGHSYKKAGKGAGTMVKGAVVGTGQFGKGVGKGIAHIFS